MTTDSETKTATQVSHTEVRVVGLDIPIGEVFTLVLKFTFAGVIVGGSLALTLWAIVVGLRAP